MKDTGRRDTIDDELSRLLDLVRRLVVDRERQRSERQLASRAQSQTEVAFCDHRGVQIGRQRLTIAVFRKTGHSLVIPDPLLQHL